MELRQEINEGLNVIENWNSANDFIYFGKGGEMASNRADDQEISMLSLHLVQLSLVYVNTLMIQQVLAEPAWRNRLNTDDRRGLTPLRYRHINPYVDIGEIFEQKACTDHMAQFSKGEMQLAVPRVGGLPPQDSRGL